MKRRGGKTLPTCHYICGPTSTSSIQTSVSSWGRAYSKFDSRHTEFRAAACVPSGERSTSEILEGRYPIQGENFAGCYCEKRCRQTEAARFSLKGTVTHRFPSFPPPKTPTTRLGPASARAALCRWRGASLSRRFRERSLGHRAGSAGRDHRPAQLESRLEQLPHHGGRLGRHGDHGPGRTRSIIKRPCR